MSEALLTIAIPTYNSIDKMADTIASLEATCDLTPCEVVFVDDCSRDDTFERLSELCAERTGWRIERLEENSGTAARPRNRAIELTRTKYVFFLDSDDVLIPEGVKAAVEIATQQDLDAVRSSLKVRFGDGSEIMADRVPGWDKLTDLASQLRAITKYQSLTCSTVFRVEMLRQHDIRFDETRRIGEDIVFTAQGLQAANRISYRDLPIRKYIRASVGEESITQRINSNQFADFVRSWHEVEQILETRNVSFVREHGFAAMNYAIRQFIWFGSEPLTREHFALFGDYCRRHWEIIETFPMRSRVKDVAKAAYDGDYEKFQDIIRLRMLVAGHDLKFMQDLLPEFEKDYQVRVDQWSGPAPSQHDLAASQDCLAWADLIWAEWMLGAAAWYSQRVENEQRLIVRTHRTEMTSDIGLDVKTDKVSAFVAISPHTLGDFADRFDIPRSKFHLIPNTFDVDGYRRVPVAEKKRHVLGMVGILPKLKRFDLALELLAELRKSDPDFELHVFGKRPDELAWLMRDDDEKAFYARCDEMVDRLGLKDSVVYRGWVDTKEALGELGAVISMSDYEGMQVALGEAYCAETLGVSLPWRGAESCYPAEFIFATVDEMAEYLRHTLDDVAAYGSATQRGRVYMEDHYALAGTVEQTQLMLKSVRA
uniref:glycosyltransferase n=1 Tax=Tessaracoccus timonensis TaxID=2161816 RepID=UPI000D54DD6F|nr:glycosyltransferase [Tessaracoccus timonensis]